MCVLTLILPSRVGIAHFLQLMNSRRDFLKSAVGATVAIAAGPTICAMCGGEAFAHDSNPAPVGTTVTFDLTLSTFSALNQKYGSVSFHVPSSSTYLVVTRPTTEPLFLVLNARCPHQGSTVERYNSRGDNKMTCPTHGSKFDIYGKCVAGPAYPTPLTLYANTFDGNHTLTTNLTPIPASIEEASSNSVIMDPVVPNPFREHTSITLHLAGDESVSLTIHDLIGREVSNLFEGVLRAGDHTIQFDGSALAAGAYLCRLTTKHGTFVKQIAKV